MRYKINDFLKSPGLESLGHSKLENHRKQIFTWGSRENVENDNTMSKPAWERSKTTLLHQKQPRIRWRLWGIDITAANGLGKIKNDITAPELVFYYL